MRLPSSPHELATELFAHSQQAAFKPQGMKLKAEGVPIIVQSKPHNCGPTALAMVSAWAGQPTPILQLERMTLTPEKSGALQVDMLSASRRLGLDVHVVNNLAELFLHLAAQRPIIVLQNLRFSWWPQWHYAVVVGYDASRRLVEIHDGAAQARQVSFKSFLQDWEDAGTWGLAVTHTNHSVRDLATQLKVP